MAKSRTPDTIALTVRERILRFCAGSGTDWQRAGVTGETVTALVVGGPSGGVRRRPRIVPVQAGGISL